MIKKLKKITFQMVAGANVATILLMFLVGFSDHLNPVSHPSLSNLGLAFPVFLFINFGFSHLLAHRQTPYGNHSVSRIPRVLCACAHVHAF
jgi:hypothetical protein